MINFENILLQVLIQILYTMKNYAKDKLILQLTSGCTKSQQELFFFYNQFRKEVDTNIKKIGNYPEAYLYLKQIEFDFIECENNYCTIKQNKQAIQLSLFDESELANPKKKN